MFSGVAYRRLRASARSLLQGRLASARILGPCNLPLRRCHSDAARGERCPTCGLPPATDKATNRCGPRSARPALRRRNCPRGSALAIYASWSYFNAVALARSHSKHVKRTLCPAELPHLERGILWSDQPRRRARCSPAVLHVQLSSTYDADLYCGRHIAGIVQRAVRTGSISVPSMVCRRGSCGSSNLSRRPHLAHRGRNRARPLYLHESAASWASTLSAVYSAASLAPRRRGLPAFFSTGARNLPV